MGRILIAGDLFPVEKNRELFEAGDVEVLFGNELAELFAGSDYSICNFEGCFTETGEPNEKCGPSVKAPHGTLCAIKKLGIDCGTIGNTHLMDFGRTGFEETCRALTENGIAYLGAGASKDSVITHHTVEIDGKVVTFYNPTERFFNAPGEDYPGVHVYDELSVCAELAELKEACDLLVVLFHGGIETTHYCTPSVRTAFHRMADAGADIIISQHTHAIGETECYNGSYLLYGQGNFCFNLSKKVNEFTKEGLLLEVIWDEDESAGADERNGKEHKAELVLPELGIRIRHYLIKRTEAGCMLDPEQDLSGLEERSLQLQKLYAGDADAAELFDREFSKATMAYMPRILRSFRGINPADDEACENLSPEEVMEYLKGRYTRRQLLAIKMVLDSPEFNELCSKGIEDLLKTE